MRSYREIASLIRLIFSNCLFNRLGDFVHQLKNSVQRVFHGEQIDGGVTELKNPLNIQRVFIPKHLALNDSFVILRDGPVIVELGVDFDELLVHVDGLVSKPYRTAPC